MPTGPFDSNLAHTGLDRLTNIEQYLQGQVVPRTQISTSAAGVISAPFHSTVASTATAPATQTVYGILIGLRAGDIVNGLMLRNGVAAAGTLPTTARAGLADGTGKILALTGNVNALASWPAGAMPLPFAAPYTVLADGGYLACFVVNGVWGSTQPTPILVTNTAAAALTAYGTNPPPTFLWAGQTDLPAVGASMTITTGSVRGYYIAAY